MSEKKRAKIEFSPHTVVYLDILGFSRFVEKAETDPDRLESLNKLFNEVIPREVSSDGKNSEYPENLGLKCLSCSDSFVVSAPVSKESSYPTLIAVSIKAIQIAHSLLNMGFLVRGAIAIGNVHRTDSNILGTGFQEAVKEDKGNPRIVLTESAEQALNELIEKGWPRYAIFAKDEPGQVILNSIHPEQSFFPDKKGSPSEYFRTYRETLLKNLSNNDLDTDARQKWLWFAGLFNANIKQLFSPMTGQKPPPRIETDGILPTFILNYLNPLDPNWMETFKAPGVKIRIHKPI